MEGAGVVKALLRPANFTLGPDAILNKTVKQKAKWAAVEGYQNASITTQLVKQKEKWVAIEDGDHNASITTHIEKTESNAGTTKLQKATKSKNNTRTSALERSVE